MEGQENLQEILSKQLLLCQFLMALSVVRTGNASSGVSPAWGPLEALFGHEHVWGFGVRKKKNLLKSGVSWLNGEFREVSAIESPRVPSKTETTP